MYGLKEVFNKPVGKILYDATCFGELSTVDMFFPRIFYGTA